MDFVSRFILELVRENGGKCELKQQIVGAMQYRKWLSYIPDFLQDYIDELSSTNVSELSSQQLNDYKEFLEEQKMLKELEQYFKEEWAFADVEYIREYIGKHPLSKIKKSRLTFKEYKNIIDEIHKRFGDYSETYIDIVSDSFDTFNFKMYRKEYYDSLSMVEAFIYDFENNIDFNQSMAALNADIRDDFRRNDIMRANSEIIASRSFTR